MGNVQDAFKVAPEVAREMVMDLLGNGPLPAGDIIKMLNGKAYRNHPTHLIRVWEYPNEWRIIDRAIQYLRKHDKIFLNENRKWQIK